MTIYGNMFRETKRGWLLVGFQRAMIGILLIGLGIGEARACGGRSPYFGEGAQVLEGHSYANDDQFVIKHMDMRLWVNFEKKEIEGWVEYDLVHAYLRDTRPAAAHHRMDKINPITGNHILVLDHRDMDVLGVYAGGDYYRKTGQLKSGAKGLKFSVSSGDADSLLFGRPLEIEVPRSQSKIVIHYRTRPSAGALQWLSPEQTYDQTHPFLFSQSQAILARTWIPLQDKPSVRFTYSAEVRVVSAAEGGAANYKPTDFNVVMSAVKFGNPDGDLVLRNPDGSLNLKKSRIGPRCWPIGTPLQNETIGKQDHISPSEKVHRFEQKKPIPSYLMAIAVGSFGYKSLGKNTGVYAEHNLLEKAAWEFTDLQKMVDAASEMFGEYAWGNYNVLVLPTSFPFGGMENPVVTFATPTIIAGDRSLVSLLAHELAHSWSGNLVTNRTWDDFWLNEGFTVYVESRIMERLYGAEYADMLRVLGKGELDKTLGWMLEESPDDSHLRLHLGDRDPDDGLTDIAYEKGRFFLMMLEQGYDRQAFDVFLNRYFKQHAFGTVTTDMFLADLKAFHASQGDKLGWTWNIIEPKVLNWIDGMGLPAEGVGGFPALESVALKRVEQELHKFLVSGEPLHSGSSIPCNAAVIDTAGFTTHHWLHFLRLLHTRPDGSEGRLSRDEMEGLDARFGFTKTGNAEIACDWFVLAIHSDYRGSVNEVYPGSVYQAMHDFLLKVGRRKFLMPIYEALLKQLKVKDGVYVDDSVMGKEMATEIFLQAEPGYHSVASRSIRELLGLPLTGGSGR